ncbi:cobalt-precorrin-5B (C(1))-methyltransferase [Maritimibacter sp. DP1N21-5]|uniref:cobalt-precorrin-5B (C(1))-methyltransferase n=1 Tax=Maritimibacter sp. DP1N21-5 TaxID=2836867 RepID=UPI001C4524C2|nr:cobalt-precorrin-5B (C(1))-methyltransferase [Maritimibacter sp. DP1N21-5]MBV7409970.1 cobalt-precorrin-5B (C(1))-methyltransferase [Maritimibacter sp. DP1N21-5]
MNDTSVRELRRGWTTGACATAAVRAALLRLWGGAWPDDVTITLPRGETPTFPLAHVAEGEGWAEVGITKDAGDDPDVTHGALIVARVTPGGTGVRFEAGPGVGIVTKPGLPIAPGEPAINPVPREMMAAQVAELAARFGQSPDVLITVSIPGGEAIAAKTWNPRLGIEGGLSVLGTTGIVRPFSCAAWIASIHRGIDVARAEGLTHVAGCTGATSERAVRALYGLPEGAMLDMGDFVGGMLKYLSTHPVDRVTVGGGIGKITKLAQGAWDLHSKRAQVDMGALADWLEEPRIKKMNSALEAYEFAGEKLPDIVARRALDQIRDRFGKDTRFDVVIVDRAGAVIGRAGP